ncbi:hypothetical protein JXR93_05165 [bacterium]|nr:hypothetical protein [bacterium]
MLKYIFIILCFINIPLLGQYLNIEPDIKLGTGVNFLKGYNQVNTIRTRTYIQNDINIIVDENRSFFWGISNGMEFEVRLAYFPGAYLKVESSSKIVNYFALAGFELMVLPDMAFGLRFGGGVTYKIAEKFSAIFQTELKPYLFGEDLGENMTLYLNFLLGVSSIF